MKILSYFYGALRDLIIRYLPNFHKKIILFRFFAVQPEKHGGYL